MHGEYCSFLISSVAKMFIFAQKFFKQLYSRIKLIALLSKTFKCIVHNKLGNARPTGVSLA